MSMHEPQNRVESPPARASRAPAQEPIAIIGMSCLFPDAPGLKEYWRLIRRGEDAIRDVPPTHWSREDYLADDRRPDHVYCARGGFLEPTPFAPMEFGIPPTTLEATDTAQLLGLLVGKRALEDAGYGGEREFDRGRAGVILGVTGTQELVIPLGARLGHPIWARALQNAGVAPPVAERVLREISDSYVSWQEGSFPGLLGNVVAGRIANRLNLHGTNCVVDAACASSLSAVHLGVLELISGRADMVLSGGVDTLNDIFMFMCFSRTQALSEAGDARPFSAQADGTVLGEGVGMLVLKRFSDAQRDGDRVYALIRGIGTSSDGRSQSIYAPRAEGQARALRNAYEISGVSPAQVQLVEAHGTGTKVGDLVEFDALRTVYREARSDGAWCTLGSIKSQIGHTKAAAGAASLIKSILALHHRVLPPTIKVDAPHPKLELETSPFHLSAQPRPWFALPEARRYAGVSSFGFGGSNFHTVLEEGPAPCREPAWDGSVQIIALSAESAEELAQRLDAWAALAASDSFRDAALARRAAESRNAFNAAQPFRLALVHERGDDLRRLISLAQQNLAQRGATQAWATGNVFFGGAEAPGEIAFLFPGQGSQYTGMCRDIICMFPEAHDAFAAADVPISGAALHDYVYPPPSFDESQAAARQQALTQTNVAQPALGAVSAALLQVLQRFGIRPHFVAGHSFGELTALHAAGCLDAHVLHELARLRGELMAEAAKAGADGAMLAVQAPLDELDRLLETHDFDVELANRNGPTQGVLAGSRGSLERLAAFLDERGWPSKLLQVSAAFHTRFMAEAEKRLRAALEHVPFSGAQIPVFANSTGQPYPLSVDGMRHLLADQLTRPVLFMEEIRNLYDAGVRTFIEVGPKRVLTGLASSILQGRPHHAAALDASFGRASGIVDLARVVALVSVLGHAVDLAAWENTPLEAPAFGPTISLLGANYRAPRPAAPPETAAEAPRPFPDPVKAADMHKAAADIPQHPAPAAHAPADFGSAGPAPEPAAPLSARHNLQHPPSPPLATAAHGDAASQNTLIAAFQVAQEGLRSMQALQQQTAAAHERFLEAQVKAHETFQQVLQAHQRLVEGALGLPGAAPTAGAGQSPSMPTLPSAAHDGQRGFLPGVPEAAPIPQAHAPQSATRETPTPVPIAPSPANPVSRETPQHVPAPAGNGHSSAALQTALFEAINETTGYPASALHLDMALEADLGIDRVRRREVLAALERRVAPLPGALHEGADDLQTLRQIVELAGNGHAPTRHAPASAAVDAFDGAAATRADRAAVETAAPAEAAGAADDAAGQVLLEVVAELTGYPVEMLDLDMDLEADLGIDSIKRLEILSAVQRRLPELQQVDSQYMGSLRTLRNIIDHMTGGDGGGGGGIKKGDGGSRAEQHAAAGSAVAAPAPVNARTAPRALPRYVLERVELPAVGEDGALPIASGSEVWITDDGTPLAAALVEALGRRGVDGHIIAPHTAVDAPPNNGEGAGEGTKPAGLIILWPPQADNAELLPASSEQWLTWAFSLVRENARALRCARTGCNPVPQVSAAPQLSEASQERRTLLVTVARMDGRFGLGGGEFDPVAGGLAGLAKTAAQEWPEVRCRALDVAADWQDLEAISGAIVRELGADGPQEVGLSADGRYSLRLVEQAAPEDGPLPLEAGDLVIVTGGARGVTAAAALALARAARPTLVLLGRSPLPPAEEPAWAAGLEDESALKRALLQNLNGKQVRPAELEHAYAELMAAREIRRTLALLKSAATAVHYYEVDVRDAEAMARVCESVRREIGPIRGIIHGAGVIEDRRIEDKSDESFGRVVETKVRGLANLLAGADAESLRCLVLFSSVSGRFGRAGQVDYAVANEILNKAAQRLSRDRPHCRVLALNWGAWDGGMVTPALKRELQRQRVELIPLEAGAAAMVAELRSAAPPAEVVLGQRLPATQAETPLAPAARPEKPAASRATALSEAFSRTLDRARDAFIDSHVIAGRPVLPVVMMLEWFGHAALHGNPGLRLCGVRDLRVLKGVILKDASHPLRFFASKAKRSNGLYEVELELRGGPASRETLHARAVAQLADELPAPAGLPALHAEQLTPYPASVAEAYREVLFHGPLFHGIETLAGHSPGGMAAQVRTAPPPGEWMRESPRSDWLTDPLALDAGLQLGLLWCHANVGAVALPSFVGRYRQFVERFPQQAVVNAALVVRDYSAGRLLGDVVFSAATVRGRLLETPSAKQVGDRCLTVAALNEAPLAVLEGVEWTADPALNETVKPAAAAKT